MIKRLLPSYSANEYVFTFPVITHFSTSSDLFLCSALARAMAPVSVRPLCRRLQ